MEARKRLSVSSACGMIWSHSFIGISGCRWIIHLRIFLLCVYCHFSSIVPTLMRWRLVYLCFTMDFLDNLILRYQAGNISLCAHGVSILRVIIHTHQQLLLLGKILVLLQKLHLYHSRKSLINNCFFLTRHEQIDLLNRNMQCF